MCFVGIIQFVFISPCLIQHLFCLRSDKTGWSTLIFILLVVSVNVYNLSFSPLSLADICLFKGTSRYKIRKRRNQKKISTPKTEMGKN